MFIRISLILQSLYPNVGFTWKVYFILEHHKILPLIMLVTRAGVTESGSGVKTFYTTLFFLHKENINTVLPDGHTYDLSSLMEQHIY